MKHSVYVCKKCGTRYQIKSEGILDWIFDGIGDNPLGAVILTIAGMFGIGLMIILLILYI